MLSTPGKTKVLLAYKRRNEAEDVFWNFFKEQGWEGKLIYGYDSVPSSPFGDGRKFKSTSLIHDGVGIWEFMKPVTQIST